MVPEKSPPPTAPPPHGAEPPPAAGIPTAAPPSNYHFMDKGQARKFAAAFRGLACGASGALYALKTFITGVACIYSCFYSSKMRRQYMLTETPCVDSLIPCCCELGQGNVEQQNQGVTMATFVQGE
ncbi:hypothetical protein CDL12_24218 [Handroanthus impetiginosus]|uniref:Uncharacterized protein n=1 Tax=Handroanthus impetiginosus TaxID=429701 RepID=A0A2G9GE23_9LAMI|nr:hypothetical protein CDL12_24218 [Handroanthus impetiginosus]